MRKKVFQLSMFIISLTLIMGLFINVTNQNQVEAKDEAQSGPEITDYFTVINEDGSTSIIDFDDIENDDSKIIEETKEYDLIAKTGDEKEVIATYESEEEAQEALDNKVNAKSKLRARTFSATTYAVEEKTKDIEYGVVYLNAKGHDGNSYLTYDNVLTGYDGYTTGSYAKDAAYIGTVNGKIRAKQAGTIMDFNKNDVTIVDYKDKETKISHYKVEDGYLYHIYYYGTNGSSKQRVGKKPSYLNTGTTYYSYDGHYFYTSYPTMIKDYQNSNTSYPNAVNKSNPFYNYYQFLSHRSKTTLTASNFNAITNDKAGSSSSKMKNMGQYYIENQNTYGTNALLMFGVSGNESAWGTSAIAMDKNNLFGHGAVDSNPYYGANGYANPQTSIKYHAEKFISNGYLDNEDWRYNGGHLGDKLSGINVRYASDPYWGEKAASVNYYYNYGSDYNKYTIGIINGQQKSYKLYKEPNSTVTHTLGSGNSPRTYNLPVIILDTVAVSGKKWHKIQSDTALNSSRTDTDWDNKYSFSRDYLYIPASDVTIVTNGSDSSTSDGSTSYTRGDVNSDGKVDSMDMYQIIQHILGKSKLTGNNYKAADTNSDNKIDSMDMYNVIQIILKK
ncbi:glucosaminidase domain-containing protein [Clostridium sp. C1]|uniref:glucosaminidase domain-containing protein n=1 Tax=Clostridium sp. C1 TaxID=1155388 RepID=UPI001BA888C4|nr:glucosaminidase domain-containing protein [Clostridium sp. C1]QUN13370.1 glucosaminidase domain-containing protein [Clostridium sp. C1]